MTDDEELVRGLRIDADQCFTKCDPTKKWCKCAFYTRIADRIEADGRQIAALKRRVEQLKSMFDTVSKKLEKAHTELRGTK